MCECAFSCAQPKRALERRVVRGTCLRASPWHACNSRRVPPKHSERCRPTPRPAKTHAGLNASKRKKRTPVPQDARELFDAARSLAREHVEPMLRVARVPRVFHSPPRLPRSLASTLTVARSRFNETVLNYSSESPEMSLWVLIYWVYFRWGGFIHFCGFSQLHTET